MKYFNYTLFVLSVFVAVLNATKINFEAPFVKDSFVAIIAVLAAMCIITSCLMLLTSKIIEEKYYNLLR